jgi:hypothetical protein
MYLPGPVVTPVVPASVTEAVDGGVPLELVTLAGLHAVIPAPIAAIASTDSNGFVVLMTSP